jgi:hypothetical protein
MAKKKVREEEDPAADVLDEVEFEPAEDAPAAAADGKVVLPDSVGEPDEPAIHDPGWTAYALSKLTPQEMVNGKPRVPGLRRLVALLVGDIVGNTTEQVQAPCPANGYIATVQARLVILWSKGVPENGAFAREFTALADVYAGNTDPAFARFASQTAETRAEGRAIKKALMLQVTTAEEMTDVSVDQADLDGKVTATQVNFIDLKCQQNDINVLAFIGSYKGKYRAVKEVPADVAGKMIQHLSELQQDRKRIPDHIRGYAKDWNDE